MPENTETPIVHVFLPTGKTFTFKGEVVGDTENELRVEYTAVSDGRTAVVRIRKEAIVAWSVKA